MVISREQQKPLSDNGHAKPHKNQVQQFGKARSRAVKARRAPNPYPTEEKEHLALATYLDYRFGPYGWYHAANERMATKLYHYKLREKGTRKGFPDFLILVAVKKPIEGRADMFLRTWSGMAIELKRQKQGRVTPEQEEWLRHLADNDFATMVAHGAQEAIDEIEKVYGKWVTTPTL